MGCYVMAALRHLSAVGCGSSPKRQWRSLLKANNIHRHKLIIINNLRTNIILNRRSLFNLGERCSPKPPRKEGKNCQMKQPSKSGCFIFLPLLDRPYSKYKTNYANFKSTVTLYKYKKLINSKRQCPL